MLVHFTKEQYLTKPKDEIPRVSNELIRSKPENLTIDEIIARLQAGEYAEARW